MKRLVLVRHGENIWNQENRFTGWTDVGLSETGLEEASAAGGILRQQGYFFDVAFASMLKRTIKTLNPLRSFYLGEAEAVRRVAQAVADQLRV